MGVPYICLLFMGGNMKKIIKSLLIPALVILFISNTFAQKDTSENILFVIPAQSLAAFSARLFPYKINMGKNFTGALWIKSIKNFKIEADKISFSVQIYGKDISYTAKAGNASPKIALGSIHLFNEWESVFRFDKDKKILYLKPHLKNKPADKKTNQKEMMFNALLSFFSDIEYPIDLQKTSPITAEVLGNVLTVRFDISDIYAADNKLMLKLKPVPQKKTSPKPFADKNG